MQWDLISWKEFERAIQVGADIGLLPCGSMEPHGMHLPLGTDGHIAHAICRKISQQIPAIVVPPIFFGVCDHPYDITAVPGTHNMDDDILIKLYLSIAVSLARYGVRRFLMLNGHCGNTAACEIAARKIRLETGGAAGFITWKGAADHVIRKMRSQGPHMGIHACEIETSVALSVMPEHVEMAKAVRQDKVVYPETFLSWDVDPGARASYNWNFDRSRSESVNMGDPSSATAEMGDAIVEATVSQAIKLLEAMKGQINA